MLGYPSREEPMETISARQSEIVALARVQGRVSVDGPPSAKGTGAFNPRRL